MATQANFQQIGSDTIFFGSNVTPSTTPVGPNGVAGAIIPDPMGVFPTFTKILVGLDVPAPAGGIEFSLLPSTDQGSTYGLAVNVTIPAGARQAQANFSYNSGGRFAVRAVRLGAAVNQQFCMSVTVF